MTIRWGIIGCGNVCELKSAPALYKTEGSELWVVMRRNAALGEDFARRHGVRHFTTDAQAVIDDPKVDAVYIATPPGSHAEYAAKVAAAGKPCYVEKPMARSAAECRRMLDAFKLAGQPLFVAYYRRALPRFVKLKQLIDSGRLGAVVTVAYSLKRPWRPLDAAPYDRTMLLPWRLDAVKSGGGLFLDLGSHVVDLLHYLLGTSVEVTGVAKNHAEQALVEDTVVGTLMFASGAVGTLNFCFAASVYEDCLDVIGDRGRVRCSVFGSEPLELCDEHGTEPIATEHPHHVQAPLIASMVQQLSGQGTSCPSTGDTALLASVAMDRLLWGYYGGRDDAFWQRPQTWPGLRVGGTRPTRTPQPD